MSKVIKTIIHDCSSCPFSKATRNYTRDSFEMEFNWYCNNEASRIGVFDMKETVNIPTWCPLPEHTSE